MAVIMVRVLRDVFIAAGYKYICEEGQLSVNYCSKTDCGGQCILAASYSGCNGNITSDQGMLIECYSSGFLLTASFVFIFVAFILVVL